MILYSVNRMASIPVTIFEKILSKALAFEQMREHPLPDEAPSRQIHGDSISGQCSRFSAPLAAVRKRPRQRRRQSPPPTPLRPRDNPAPPWFDGAVVSISRPFFFFEIFAFQMSTQGRGEGLDDAEL